MKRREFIKFSTFTFIAFKSTEVFAKVFTKEDLLILENLFEILFPKTKEMPSSKQFGALSFLVKTINHSSFNNSDKSFVLQGLKDFNSSFPNFINLEKQKKEKLIYEIVNSNDYAQSWLSKLVYYGIEALLGDPIYGGNKNQIGWQSLRHNVGYPRPKLKYGQKL